MWNKIGTPVLWPGNTCKLLSMKQKLLLAVFALSMFASAFAVADPPVPICPTYTCSGGSGSGSGNSNN